MIRGLTQWHENDRIVAAAQSPAGRLSVWAVAMGLLFVLKVPNLILIGMTGVMLVPDHRRLILSLTAVGMIMLYVFALPIYSELFDSTNIDLSLWTGVLIRVFSIIAVLYASFFAARRFDQLPALIRRYPLLSFHAGLLTALFLLGAVPWLYEHTAMLMLVPLLTWRIGYMILAASHGKVRGTTFKDHLFYLWPPFVGLGLPIGKGFEYLARHEAVDSLTLARSQVAGIKLLMLCLIWRWTYGAMDAVVFGVTDNDFAAWFNGWTVGIPLLPDAIRADFYAPAPIAWASLFMELIAMCLRTAVYAHLTVGSIRLMGFNIFRNTYRPLLAESVIDFWTRFNYYFKEVCVDFFFYPVYLRSRWAAPRVRLFMAVFAAAFAGNVYYHVLTSPFLLVDGDLAALWSRWDAHMIYCLLLTAGIWVSMLRQQASRASESGASPPLMLRVRRIAGVWLFYAIIHIWNVKAPGANLSDRTGFFMSLFGI